MARKERQDSSRNHARISDARPSETAGNVPVVAGPVCTCRSFRFPHLPSEHRRKLKSDYDWRTFDELKNTQMFGDRFS